MGGAELAPRVDIATGLVFLDVALFDFVAILFKQFFCSLKGVGTLPIASLEDGIQ